MGVRRVGGRSAPPGARVAVVNILSPTKTGLGPSATDEALRSSNARTPQHTCSCNARGTGSAQDKKGGPQDLASARGAGRIKRPEWERTGSNPQNGSAQDLFCRTAAFRIKTPERRPAGSSREKEGLRGSKEKFLGSAAPIGAWLELQPPAGPPERESRLRALFIQDVGVRQRVGRHYDSACCRTTTSRARGCFVLVCRFRRQVG